METSYLFVFFQLLVREAAILVILKSFFVACGHVECQTGPFGTIWDGLRCSQLPVEAIDLFVFPVTSSRGSHFDYL